MEPHGFIELNENESMEVDGGAVGHIIVVGCVVAFLAGVYNGMHE